MNSRQVEFSSISRDYRRLERLISKAQHSSGKKRKRYADRAVKFASRSSSGILASSELEELYLEFSRSIRSPKMNADYEPSTTLHVMSKAFATGGHTRVVERWVSASEDGYHSVALTAMGTKKLPPSFRSAFEREGFKIYSLNSIWSDFKKASRLRELASRFERIVLHVHPNDTIPLLAFGVEEFQRPVVLYNHADHLFSVGFSIADLVAETRHWGRDISRDQRGITHNMVLGIPVDVDNLNLRHNRSEYRRKLGFSEETKLIVSAGPPYKYAQFGEQEFGRVINEILNQNQSAIFICVGPKMQDVEQWEDYFLDKRDRFKLKGYTLPHELNELIAACDLYIDSFPAGGGTILQDVATIGVPCLVTNCVTGHLASVLGTAAYCKDEKELIRKAKHILSHENVAKKNVDEFRDLFSIDLQGNSWKKKVEGMHNLLVESHKTHQLLSVIEPIVNDLAKFRLISLNQKRLLFAFGFFEVFQHMDFGIRRFSLKLRFPWVR
ncbi:hypothetical protein N9X76_01360 [Alphaproteobacteria bacterium]|nr:hypothetical protein [Alphaproteobacteria bacterium]